MMLYLAMSANSEDELRLWRSLREAESSLHGGDGALNGVGPEVFGPDGPRCVGDGLRFAGRRPVTISLRTVVVLTPSASAACSIVRRAALWASGTKIGM